MVKLMGAVFVCISVWLVYGIACLFARAWVNCANCKFSVPSQGSEEIKCQLTGYSYPPSYSCKRSEPKEVDDIRHEESEETSLEGSEQRIKPLIARSPKRRTHYLILGFLFALALVLVGIPIGIYFGGRAFINYAKENIEKSPLYVAVATNNISEVDRLLAEGANPNEKVMMGHSPLIMATRCGYSLIAEHLLKAGANPNQKDSLKWAPLHHAVKVDNANLDMITILVRHNAEVNITDNHLRTPLHRAAQFGHVEAVRLLLRLGANPNAKDENGWTPLDRGAAHASICQVLQARGSSIEK